MATFKVHEDYSNMIENRRPKNIKTLKPLKSNEARSALQPITSIQQNTRRPKPVEKDKCVKPQAVSRVMTPGPLTPLNFEQCTLKLKPVFKKTHLVQKSNSIEKEYEEEIFRYLLNRQKHTQFIKPYYMTKQIHLNWDMRSVLIDWLVSVADEFKMSNKTVHLTVNYIDRFLSNISVVSTREKTF